MTIGHYTIFGGFKVIVNSKKILILCLSAILVLTSLGFVNSNQTKADTKESQEQKAKELQSEILFAMNEATESNQDGEVTKVNTKKIKERYGYIPKEYKQIQQDINNDMPMVNALKAKLPKTANQCFNEKMSGMLGDLIPVAAFSRIYSNPNPKNILYFSKQAIKAGLKGNAVSIAGQITYYYSYCSTHYPDIT